MRKNKDEVAICDIKSVRKTQIVVNISEYQFNKFEKAIIEESIFEYEKGNIISNEDVFKKTKKWLEK